jgi:GTP-binding protein HflX
LAYLLPRLRGWGEALSRQVGGRAAGGVGIGGRGPGETKIELDRRRIRDRMAKLRREIAGMRTIRDTKRGSRRRNEVPAVAIVGYTNAGKSSLLNAITGAGVLVEDALFATLDPTTRRHRTADGRVYTLTDTVGFVRHLPHQLIEAFRSTLEESGLSDLLVHVVDGSDALPLEQIKAVRSVLAEIADEQKRTMPPELLVVNKVDAVDDLQLARLRNLLPGAVFVSARSGDGMDRLVEIISERLPQPTVEVDVLLPYTEGALAARVHEQGQVLEEEHREAGTWLRARVSAELAAALSGFGTEVGASA